MTLVTSRRDPDARGYFGEFGGRFVPETLVEPIEELERAYLEACDDPAFQAELSRLLTHYVGRATPVFEARRLTAEAGGARIFLKREDLTHTGAPRTWVGRRSTSSACGCWVPKCCASTVAAER